MGLILITGLPSLYKKGEPGKYDFHHLAIQSISDSTNSLAESFSNAVLGKPDNKNDDW